MEQNNLEKDHEIDYSVEETTPERVLRKESNYKMILDTSIFLSIVAIIISLFFLFLSPYIIYGTLYGLLGLWTSYGIITILYKKASIAVFSWGTFLVRIFIFIVMFLILVLVFNGPLLNEGDKYSLLAPLDSVAFFFSYMIFAWSAFLIPYYQYVYDFVSVKMLKK